MKQSSVDSLSSRNSSSAQGAYKAMRYNRKTAGQSKIELSPLRHGYMTQGASSINNLISIKTSPAKKKKKAAARSKTKKTTSVLSKEQREQYQGLSRSARDLEFSYMLDKRCAYLENKFSAQGIKVGKVTKAESRANL